MCAHLGVGGGAKGQTMSSHSGEDVILSTAIEAPGPVLVLGAEASRTHFLCIYRSQTKRVRARCIQIQGSGEDETPPSGAVSAYTDQSR